MKDKIQKELIDAMKAHDKRKIDVIKLVKAAIQNEEISLKKELSDDEVLSIITKQVKMRNDAIKEFEKANRTDLIDAYNLEIDILSEYLPKALTEEEAIKIIDEVFKKVNPSSEKEMGLIMKELTPLVKGKADMKEVSNLIKDKLKNI